MKVTLKFEDFEEAKHHLNGMNYYCCLWDLKEHLRFKLKYEELSEDEYRVIEEIQTRFFEILEGNDVNLN
jgi:hypothetical protein